MEMLRSDTGSVNNHSQVRVCSPDPAELVQAARMSDSSGLNYSSGCSTPPTSGGVLRPSVLLVS